MKNLEDVTKQDFEAYEWVRQSGLLNMFDSRVCGLAGFDRDTYVSILHNYSALMEKWPDVRKE